MIGVKVLLNSLCHFKMAAFYFKKVSVVFGHVFLMKEYRPTVSFLSFARQNIKFSF